MAVPTEEIIIATTPEIKEFLSNEAIKEGVSISEWILRRCIEPAMSDEEKAALAALVNEINISAKRAKISLDQGLAALNSAVAEVKSVQGES